MRSVRELMGDKRVAAVLAGIAIVFVGYRLIGSGRGSAPEGPATAVVQPPSAAVQEPEPASAAPSPSPATASAGRPIPPGWTGPSWPWNRNPFLDHAAERPPADRVAGDAGGDGAPPVREGEGLPDLRGTIVSGTISMAIFRSDRPGGGTRLVSVGGVVGDWTLSGVEPYRVSLRRGKETRVLELYKQ